MAVKAQSSVQLFDQSKAISALQQRYIHQRNISPLQLQTLKTAMLEGSFSPVNTIMFAQVGDDNVLINGQHTLRSIADTNCSYAMPVVQYHCDTENERAQLYYRVDKQRRRSLGDSVRSLDLSSVIGLTPTQIKVTVSAFRHIKGNWGVVRDIFATLSDDKSLSMLHHWRDDVFAIYDAITPCSHDERNMILRKAVFSVALITMHYSKDRAFSFWRQVVQDDGLDRYDPRKTIRTWLSQKARRRSSGFAETPLESEVSRAVALAWNAYYDGRTLRYTLVRDTLKPMVLLGTPYNGSQDKEFLPEWSKFDFGQELLDARSVA